MNSDASLRIVAAPDVAAYGQHHDLEPALASWVFLHGAGGGTTLWQPIADHLGGTVLELPPLSSIDTLADALEASVWAMPGPRILVGNSLGALVALELAQRVPVAGLMLIAAGWEFPVSEELIRRVESGASSVFRESARRCVKRDAPMDQVDAVVSDFETRPAGTMAEHLRAIRDHEPRIDHAVEQPTTFVVRGSHDRSVSLRDHLELAERTGGALVPLATAAHMPFVDHSEEVVRWLRRLEAMVTSP